MIEAKAVVDRSGRVLDDHGTVLIFPSKSASGRYLQPHIIRHLKQQHGRVWLSPYEEKRTDIAQTAYASGKGEEIK